MVLFPAPAGPSMAMISLREEGSLIRRRRIVHAGTQTQTSTKQGLEFCISRLLWQTPCGSNEHVCRNRGGWDAIGLWNWKLARRSEDGCEDVHVSRLHADRRWRITEGS